MDNAQIGVVGLAVMGSNLARNIERNGYSVSVYNRTNAVTLEFMDAFGDGKFVGPESLEAFVASLSSPRQIILMIKAGKPTDAVIEQLVPLLEPGDIIIDGGNAWFEDTVRREARLKDVGIYFLGVGISGGEEGALNGPSLMPGGPKEAWQIVAPLLDKIAARADGDPCTAYMGPDGAGHFVKMVHNGIEYGDMQLIAESYHLLRSVGQLDNSVLAKTFTEWNKGELSSYLIEITSKIFSKADDKGSGELVDKILDKAGQKGTGRWTVQIALELGVSIPTIAAAVDARVLSAAKDQREHAAEILTEAGVLDAAPGAGFVETVHDALYCAKILSYAQGMALLGTASQQYSWELDLASIASIWRGGCIIRAALLKEIQDAFGASPELANLMLQDAIRKKLASKIGALRQAVNLGVAAGIPLPALASSLAYFDSYRTARLPQNLTQAQRDFFGAHTYERVDQTGSFHTEWEA